MIVGVCGPSCSGKTALTRALAALLDAETLHLDARYVEGSETPVVRGHRSYERPHQYDGAGLLRDALAVAATGRHVVVEGFVLFAYPGMMEACDRLVYVDAPHATLVARRLARTTSGSAAGDIPGGRDAGVDAGWLAHGETEWRDHGAFQRDLPGIVVVDGSGAERPDAIAARLVADWRGTSTETRGATWKTA